MSYITFIQPEAADDVLSTPAARRTVQPGPAIGRGLSGRLSAGLEAALLVGTLSALSLVFCTVAAGAL